LPWRDAHDWQWCSNLFHFYQMPNMCHENKPHTITPPPVMLMCMMDACSHVVFSIPQSSHQCETPGTWVHQTKATFFQFNCVQCFLSPMLFLGFCWKMWDTVRSRYVELCILLWVLGTNVVLDCQFDELFPFCCSAQFVSASFHQLSVFNHWTAIGWWVVVDHSWYTRETVECEKPSSVAVLYTLKLVCLSPTTMTRSKAH
jgi:hypothetical protein